MDINFAPPQELVELAEKTKAFVVDKVIPYEKDSRWTAHGPTDELRLELNALAKAAGVFAPHVPKEYGGKRPHADRPRPGVRGGGLFDRSGRSAIHCASPDEGNIHLLDVVARPDQREHFLKPLAAGHMRSCFCMTEPGRRGLRPRRCSRPRRGQDGNEWVINGRKWLITGADGAGCAIIMAKIDGGPMHGHATMFLADLPNPEIRIERTLDTIDTRLHGRPCGASSFDELRAAGRRGAGRDRQGLPLRPGAARAGAAHPLHALAGLGQRAHDIATDYAAHARGVRQAARRARGRVVHAGRQRDGHPPGAAVDLAHRLGARPGRARPNESSMAKVFCSEAIARVADRSLQILGGMGITARHGGRAHLPRHAGLPDLRRAERGAPLGAGGKDCEWEDVTPSRGTIPS